MWRGMRGKSCHGPFSDQVPFKLRLGTEDSDQVPFKLCQGTEDMEDQLAVRGGGIDLLGEALEAYTATFQRLNEFNEVGEGSPQSIQAPDHQHVTGTGMVERLGKP